MRFGLASWLALSVVAAHAQPMFPIQDVAAVPNLRDPASVAAYEDFLVTNLPRAVAISADGRIGWAGGTGTLDQQRVEALRHCAEAGGKDCAIYAEDLNVVWRGRPPQAPPVPAPLIATGNYSFVLDARYFWRGPAAAAGVYVWSHGKGNNITADERGQEPQPHVRWFNNAGFDIVRFDRYPAADDTTRAAGWLRDGLAALRRQGYRVVIAGGQSRGAWTSLTMLDTPGLADAVIAISPAAHGSGASINLLAQTDDLRALIAAAPPQRTRVVFVQFRGDFFIGDPDRRRALLEAALRPKIPALLVIDRPDGFSGHMAGASGAFAREFGACLLRFATGRGAVPASCGLAHEAPKP